MQVQTWLPLVVLIGFFAWKSFRFAQVKKKLPGLLGQGAIIVDVRTPAEYSSGHCPKSINIPLAEFDSRIQELNASVPIIVCCASGTRSGIARGILMTKGFQSVYNAGPWTNVLSASAS